MSDDYQIEIPPSFMALYTDAGRGKPNAQRSVVAGRYELCEDMANMLAGPARDTLFELGIAESDVLQRCLLGLQADGAVFSPDESQWVVRRLAELLDWPRL